MKERLIVLAVDRVEGNLLVLVDDRGKAFEVKATDLPANCRNEGAIVRVALDHQKKPNWKSAVRDKGEEIRRRTDAELSLGRLRAKDHGGDTSL